MGECVLPTVLVERAVLYRTDGILPVVTGFKVGALNNATAGETEYAGVKVGKCLCQILAQSSFTSFPGIGGEK